MAYRDLREYIRLLESKGKLRHVKVPVDRNWEISAVARETFLRHAPADRPALLFDEVIGSQFPVLVGAVGASKEIYALALETNQESILEKWARALQCPITPATVSSGPCQENVWTGREVDLTRFPIPTWTSGRDAGPYITAPCVVSRDPITGCRNVGTYRIQVKAMDKTGIFVAPGHHLLKHIQANERLGKPTQVAIVIGPDPTVSLASVTPIPEGMDEFAVASALRQEPLQLVKCISVDLEVPAYSEIVIEGEIPPVYREEEGPFGEYTGYMGPTGKSPIVNVRCITFRNNAIYQAFLSEMPPSESSCIRGVGHEAVLYHHLKHVLGLPIKSLHFKEASGSSGYLVISIHKVHPSLPKQVMWAAWSCLPDLGKITVVVDDDIDVEDDFQVDWALTFRVRPSEDIFIEKAAVPLALDPSLAPPGASQQEKFLAPASKVGIDATRKHPYPDKAFPPEEHLQLVRSRWEHYGI